MSRRKERQGARRGYGQTATTPFKTGLHNGGERPAESDRDKVYSCTRREALYKISEMS